MKNKYEYSCTNCGTQETTQTVPWGGASCSECKQRMKIRGLAGGIQ